ncbi:MAG: type IV pilus assembly protein PilY1 [Gammaproteobacteria bacterium]|jgi:type IV pilus assembly protein PilY1
METAMKPKNFANFTAATLLGLMVGIPASAPADDTEIYTGSNLLEGAKPNVMFILDTSGSMSYRDGFSEDRLDRMKNALYQVLDNVDNVNIGLMRFHDPGGPVLFPVSSVDADASDIDQAGQSIVRISDDNDDAEELLTKVIGANGPALLGDVKLDSLYLELLDTPAFGTERSRTVTLSGSASDAEQGQGLDRYSRSHYRLDLANNGGSYGIGTIGLRFSDVETNDTLRDTDDATVLFSQLALSAVDERSGPLDAKIFGLYADDMPTFPSAHTFSTAITSSGYRGCLATDSPKDIYCLLGLQDQFQYAAGITPANVASYSHGVNPAGNVTNAIVDWPEVPDTQAREQIISPDISSVVQEIFSHPTWQTSSGRDDLGIFLTATSGSHRRIESYDYSSSRAAKLRVDFVAKNNAAGRQLVALRFQDVRIPQGANIDLATLEFSALGNSNDAVTINILGEKVADAPAFTAVTTGSPNTASLKLSNRRAANPTAASVGWALSSSAAWTHEQTVQAPDIKTVLQEIVNQTDWCGNNNLVLFLEYQTFPTGPSDRRVYAHDSDPSLAASLKFSFDETDFADGEGCMTEALTRQVGADKDDAEQTVSSGNVSTAGTIMQMIQNGSTDQTNGVIFRDVRVHPGTEIVNAKVDFTTLTSESAGATTFTVKGQTGNSILRFEASGSNISNRPQTTASATFSMPSTGVSSNTIVDSADISSVIRELTGTGSGWEYGDDIALIFTGTSGQMDLYTHDRNESKSARLRLDLRYNVGTILAASSGAPNVVTTVRTRLKEIIAELTHSGYTPIVDTLYEAALYFRGGEVYYGANRGNGGSTVERNTRLSHPGSYAYDTRNLFYPAGCEVNDSNLNADACRDQRIDNSPNYTTPIADACQANFIVLLTDGAANHNHSTTEIQSMAGVTSCQSTFSNSDSVRGGERCGVDLVKYLNENDQSSTVSGNNRVSTYTIGFNISTQFLRDLALEGGGQFYEATTSSGLATVFQTIITDVLSRATSFAAPSLSVNAFNRLEDRNEVYFSLFEPSATARWDGNIKKFQLCQSTLDACHTVNGADVGDVLDKDSIEAVGDNGRILDTATSFWSIDGAEDGPEVLKGGTGADIVNRGYAARKVYTFSEQATPVAANQPAATVTFFDPPVSPSLIPVSRGRDLAIAANLLIDSDADGIIDGLDATSGSDTEHRDQTMELLGLGSASFSEIRDHIDWIRGKDVDGRSEDAVYGTSRYVFGDPLHGNPLALTYGGTEADPIIKLLVGTNDGGIRLTNSNTGEEEWVFMPPSVLPIQKDLRANASTGKVYGIDGSATPWIQDRGDIGTIEPLLGDFVRTFVGQRRGGNHYWALDVSPTTVYANDEHAVLTNIKPHLMWRITGGSTEFPMLADTWSKPFLANMLLGNVTVAQADRAAVLIFAGGYDESSQDGGSFQSANIGNSVYIVDAETGTRLFFIGGPGANLAHLGTPTADLTQGIEIPDMMFPIPSDVTAFDADGDGATDRIYVGDTGGQMWRIDIAPNRTITAGLTAVVGKLAEVSGAPEDYASRADADKRKFFYAPSLVQVRGAEGQSLNDYDLIAAVTGNRASPLNTTVQDRFYALRDYTLHALIDDDGDGRADEIEDDGNSVIDEYNLIQGALSGASDGTGATTGALVNFTTRNGFTDFDQSVTAEVTELETAKAGSGYFIDLVSGVGEKGLAAPVILAGKLFFTTYLPQDVVSTTECVLAEGRGLLYGIDVISGGAAFNWDTPADDPTHRTPSDRVYGLGAGIPSNPVSVFFPEKVMLLIGVGGGAEAVDPGIGVPKGRTYWMQQSQ